MLLLTTMYVKMARMANNFFLFPGTETLFCLFNIAVFGLDDFAVAYVIVRCLASSQTP